MFYFAWVDSTETTFNNVTHARVDEQIAEFSLSHEEGNAATLEIVIKNPRVGLLAPGRKVWAWFSTDTDSGVSALFFGRLVAIPSDLFGESCTLQFIAKPSDYLTLKQDLADGLNVLPWVDPVFIDSDSRDDPDTIFEAYSGSIHIDRITHTVSLSDDLVGEDGLEDFQEGDVPQDSLSLSLGSTPKTKVKVRATVTWSRSIGGPGSNLYLDLGPNIIPTYSSALLSDWPTGGSSLGSGWMADETIHGYDSYGPIRTYKVDLNHVALNESLTFSNSWQRKQSGYFDAPLEDGEASGGSTSRSEPSKGGLLVSMQESGSASYSEDPPAPSYITSDSGGGSQVQEIGASFLDNSTKYLTSITDSQQWQIVPLYNVACRLVLTADTSEDRTEYANFNIEVDLQDIATDTGESPPAYEETISKTGADVSKKINGVAPLSADASTSYFQTDRGQQSLEYLLLLARAHLRLKSRAISISFDCRLERMLTMSCRKSVRIHDPRIPGGMAVGKVTAYTMTGDGDTGEFVGNITIGCAVGNGDEDTIVSQTGTDAYYEDDYIEPNYYAVTGELWAITGDIGLTPPNYSNGGLPQNLHRSDVVLFEQWHNTLDDERNALLSGYTLGSTDDLSYDDYLSGKEASDVTVSSKIKNSAQWYELHLLPFDDLMSENDIDVPVTQLKIPQQINLEAVAS